MGMCAVNTDCICSIYIVKLNVIQLVEGGSFKVRADLFFPVNHIFPVIKMVLEKQLLLQFIFLYLFTEEDKLMGSYTRYLH